MKKNLEFRAEAETTLLPFLLSVLSGRSRNYVKGLLTRGQVLLAGKPCRDYARPVAPGQTVIVLPAPAVTARDLPFPILYEDDRILVIHKPAGMLSISTEKEAQRTAYYLVTDYMKKQAVPGRVWVVHRLDRDTSGVLLFAKDEEMKRILQDGWDELVVRRGYRALVEGRVDPPEGRVQSHLREGKNLVVYSSRHKGDGKPAVTNYRTVECGARYTLLDVDLETGRKNQIRVHMQDLGHPVAGDKKYGARTDPIDRLALHACELILRYPPTGKELRLEAPMPASFLRTLSQERETVPDTGRPGAGRKQSKSIRNDKGGRDTGPRPPSKNPQRRPG